MSRRKRQIRGPFVPIPLVIMDALAWRIMSFGARLLWIELRRKLRNDGLNNGKIFLSDRDAAKEIGADKGTVGRWYAELEHYGFLRKTAEGFLGGDGYGIAAKYRFTDLAYGTHPATRDYEKWDGELFVYKRRRTGRKKQNPVRKMRTHRPQNAYIRKDKNGAAVCTQNADIGEAPRCTQNTYISGLPLPASGQGPLQGSSTVRAPAQAGGAGSSPAPVTNLTEYVLAIVNAQLDARPARPLRCPS